LQSTSSSTPWSVEAWVAAAPKLHRPLVARSSGEPRRALTSSPIGKTIGVMEIRRLQPRTHTMAALGVLGLAACTGAILVDNTSGSGPGGAHAASTSGTTTTNAGTTVGAGGAAASGSSGVGGAGGAPVCGSGYTLCAGTCVDLMTDPKNCATCGTPCSAIHATTTCSMGLCVMGACDPGYAHCTGPGTECETDTTSDPANCGACGSACVVPLATPTCVQGMCAVGTCDSGWTDCNGSPADGCEANLQNDPMNCGQCGTVCGPLCICIQGQCGHSCFKGSAHCPGDPPCGCTLLGTNKNCRFCGDVCALSNATSECIPMPTGNTCTLASCNAGYLDCDKNPANGCEVDGNTDPANCGMCGNACAAGKTCVGGACM